MTARLNLIQNKSFAKGLDPVQTSTRNHAYFLEFTLIPGSFRFSEKLDYDNMSCDIKTCKEQLEWTRNFIARISFFIELPYHYKFFLWSIQTCTHLWYHQQLVVLFLFLSLLFLFFFFVFLFFLFLFYINFTGQSGGFIGKIEFTFHVIQPIPSAPAAAQDEMKRPRAFKLTVTVIDRWREVFDSQELPRLFWRVCHFRFESLALLSTWRPLVRSKE